MGAVKEWYFVTKIVLTYCEKKWFHWLKKLMKFEAEGWEFSKIFGSLEQFIQAVKKLLGFRNMQEKLENIKCLQRQFKEIFQYMNENTFRIVATFSLCPKTDSLAYF